MKTLILPVKRKWFDLIKAGTKTAEYRLRTDHWRSRLVGKEYDRVVITLGYPPREDTSRRLEFEWNGYDHATVESEEWGMRPREVFAIRLDCPMTKPIRIQLSRRKGWRMPPNTVRVCRPGQWGNPFAVTVDHDAAECVRQFRTYVESCLLDGQGYPLRELRGKNLACWCKLDAPCHADVLLELANSDPKTNGIPQS